MHEWSLGETLVHAVLAELQRVKSRPVRLVAARVAVGHWHQLVPDNLRFVYETLTRETPAAGSRLDIRAVPLAARCGACGWSGPIADLAPRCDACGGADALAITGGKELQLESLEVEPLRKASRHDHAQH